MTDVNAIDPSALNFKKGVDFGSKWIPTVQQPHKSMNYPSETWTNNLVALHWPVDIDLDIDNLKADFLFYYNRRERHCSSLNDLFFLWKHGPDYHNLDRKQRDEENTVPAALDMLTDKSVIAAKVYEMRRMSKKCVFCLTKLIDQYTFLYNNDSSEPDPRDRVVVNTLLFHGREVMLERRNVHSLMDIRNK